MLRESLFVKVVSDLKMRVVTVKLLTVKYNRCVAAEPPCVEIMMT